MSPLFKYLIVFALIAIIYNLFKAYYHLFSKKSQPKAVVKSLAIRIGLSLFLFISLILASLLGYIQPHGLLPIAPTAQPAVTQELDKTE
ncbi:MAG: hypothetical protein A6F71_00315 [Cycloclasticus sp. symbiont of Poecilosclerida sp. M]|nr:MAG: hypothetical protein A6F71_00315 [Cycloclasticus sp. symbiont of Poecilosclerida sp. M]